MLRKKSQDFDEEDFEDIQEIKTKPGVKPLNKTQDSERTSSSYDDEDDDEDWDDSSKKKKLFSKAKKSKKKLDDEDYDDEEDNYDDTDNYGSSNAKTPKMLKLLNPKNLFKELKIMGVDSPSSVVLTFYGLFAIILIATVILLKINIVMTIIMAIATFIFVPTYIYYYFRRKYELRRFSEVSQYIEQLLYAFKDNNKVLKSLYDIQPIFKNSLLKDDIAQEIEDIQNYDIKTAFKNFEKKFECPKLVQANNFLLEVEELGGDHSNTIELLLEDKKAWEERTLVFQKERENKLVTVALSIAISFAVCILMDKILPKQVDITKNIIVQLDTAIVYIINLILYWLTNKTCSASLLNIAKSLKDSEVKMYYKYLMNYNPHAEFIKGLKMIWIPIIIVIAGVFFKMYWVCGIGAVMALWFLFHYKFTYNARKKAILNEINIQFPKWLMQMALLVQFNSVQVSLYKSIPSAGVVLQPELIKLNNRLRENPTAIEPYLTFMEDFNIPEVTSTLRMFYAISSGAGSDTQSQINNIIKKNSVLADKSEKLAFDNSLGGLQAMFLAPQLTGGFKLLVDMVIFFVVFMGNMTF